MTVRVDWRDSAGSTQDEARSLVSAGRELPFAVATGDQRAGRGRLGRVWSAPAGSGLAVTVAVRTALPADRRGWIPLVAGLAVLEAVAEVCGPRAPRLGLKWPNDVLAEDGRKLSGLLVEGSGADVVLVGAGINLRGPVTDASGEPVSAAVWLLGEGGLLVGADGLLTDTGPGDASGRWCAGPESGPHPGQHSLSHTLAAAVAERTVGVIEALEAASGDAVSSGVLDRYSMACVTLGRAVRVEPLGPEATHASGRVSPVRGTATRIHQDGRLVVDTGAGEDVVIDVGDVRHVRDAGTGDEDTAAGGTTGT